MECTDDDTVEAVQLRAPAASKTDRDYLCDLMDRMLIFPMVCGRSARDQLKARLLQTQRLIPSLHTFLEDLKYLKPCARIVKRLVPKLREKTLRENLLFHFCGSDPPGKATIQSTDFSFFTIDASTRFKSELSYQQLWLYAFRYFPFMEQCPPRKDKGVKRPTINEPHAHLWFKFAELARRLGFRSQEIEQLIKTNSDEVIAPMSIRALRPDVMYSRKADECTSIAEDIRQAIARSFVPRDTKYLPSSSVAHPEPCLHRCGVPFDGSQRRDARYLFIDTLYHPYEQLHDGGGEIGSYFVKQAIFFAFFGDELGVPFASGCSASSTIPPSEAMRGLEPIQPSYAMQWNRTSGPRLSATIERVGFLTSF